MRWKIKGSDGKGERMSGMKGKGNSKEWRVVKGIKGK